MKKTLAIIIALAMVFCFAACGSEKQAEEETDNQNTATLGVYVTISVAGETVVTNELVEVSDYNNDGTYTVDEALKAAHVQADNEDAYSSAAGDYGTMLVKLWGDESGSFGYLLNNESLMNLDAEVQANDYLVAYVYEDLTNYSDCYAFFDKNVAENGSELTLMYSAYDENWNVVKNPIEGAEVLVGGHVIGTTDAEGKITVDISGTGKFVVTAEKEGMTLVPPICTIEIE